MRLLHTGPRTRAHSIAAMFAMILFASQFAIPAGAQNTNVAIPTQHDLALADVYRLASTNPRVDAAIALARATEARVSSARRPADPEIQIGFMNRSLPSLAPMDPLGMTQLQITQMIPVPGKLGLAGRIASEKSAGALARVSDVRWDVRTRAAMTFYDLYVADAQLSIAQKNRKLVQEIAKASRVMYSVGNGKQADVLRAQVEIARMTEDIMRMESMRSSMAGRLSALLGLPETDVIGMPSLPVFPETLAPLDELVAEALKNRPMISAGERDLAAADVGRRLAQKEIWPDFEVGVQYGWRGGVMGTERMGSLMLGATIPLYARSRQLRMREEADAMRAMSAADLAAMRVETRARMTELYADFTRAKNLRTLYQTTVLPQAEATVTASFTAYRLGTIELMALLDHQMTVNRYRQELVSLEADQGKAISEIEMLLGRELFDAARATALNVRTGR
jgi:cobalt-zinc-cadmium efflux system outer membrane protein